MITLLQSHPSRTGRMLARRLENLPGDGIVNWTGAEMPGADLNANSRTDKRAQLVALQLRGVKVPPFRLREPWPPEEPDWYGRTLTHQQGMDFTNPPGSPDFWVKRLTLEDEWRLHFCKTRAGNLRLLRSGLKLPRVRDFHPWVKSHRLGWKISYIGGAPKALVDESRLAMAALRLDFGAVDVATHFNGSPVVLEVNTCPGLDSGTLQRYVDAFEERLC